MQAKRIKILAHEVLDCSSSLWIDASIDLRKLNGGFHRIQSDLALLRHPERKCIYAEASHCKKWRRGDPRRIDAAIDRYKSEGHPADFGLWMGGIVFRRNTPAMTAFNREWWREVSMGTSRDQISLPVVLRRIGIPFETISTDVVRFRVHNHIK